jgi:predicted secreted protein
MRTRYYIDGADSRLFVTSRTKNEWDVYRGRIDNGSTYVGQVVKLSRDSFLVTPKVEPRSSKLNHNRQSIIAATRLPEAVKALARL